MMSLLMMILVVEPVSATTISDLEKEKQELENQKEDAKNKQDQEKNKLNEVTDRLSGMEDEAEVLEEEIAGVDEALIEIIASVELLKEDVAEKEEQIAETTVLYEEALAAEAAQYEAMKLRIKFMYEKGDATYLQLFLESSSLGEMVNKADYIEKLYEYDRKMLEEYRLAKENTLAIKTKLEEEMDELAAQQHEMEEEQANLEILLEEKKQLFEDYELQIAKARQEAAVYKANIKKQTEAIRKLEEEALKKESEIEAAKKAEEEAKKAQEEALKNKKKKEGNGGDDTGKNPSGDSGNSGGSGYAGPGDYTNGSKGQQIANYACQYVGNPYVFGGTSLTQGADCSGFVWRVYKDFGYSLPRTSYGQRSAGKSVAYADAQPGDIICYAGHVGIYIGNGQIVHASTQKTGIKYSRATYREILAVRRIV
ncbi:MAG: C40 family peptidase [Lachnospiraceae bacterium]|nr:C40 family peptidase [Lachnospiraceae bacterium]